MTITELLTDAARVAFGAAFGLDATALGKVVVVASGADRFGDYQCNAALALAKTLRQPPREVAERAASETKWPDAVDRVEIAGAGFLNFHLRDAWLAARIEEMAADARLGVPVPGAGHTIVMDYSSPNVAKPMHIGHIRSTIIGHALDRLHRFLGYRVIADNHVGDWGTQFGILIMGYRHFAEKDALKDSPVDELERVYVKSYERSAGDPTWLDQCRHELVKLQAGNAENRALWEEFVKLSLREFERIYARLGVTFDLVRGESHYNERLPGVVERLRQMGLAEESEGAQVVFLDDEKLPVCIIRKSDGAFNYATTDLATVCSRVAEFKPDRIVYVTDERQQLHFRQVFAICRKMGIAVDLQHVWFGLMRLPEGTFSTREGNVIKLERLLDEAEARALAIVREASPEMDPAQQAAVARAVGIGAVKYSDLSQNPQSTVTFTWKKALSLDGNSAPYLQYACARIASVEDKYHERFPAGELGAHAVRFSEPVERALALKLVRFPETLMLAARSYKPSVIADYLYDLAQTYSSFYQNVPFLKAPDGVRESRVRLCGVIARTLRQGLALLGIEAPERI
ncbi:MAG: arginine--tRNA ligase [Kiritimatiellae bacterium]|nr:arginine--tRNA ligase [Kiritimatiellia bacterium]